MRNLRKMMLAGMACCLYVSGLLAGGIVTNTNQSVHFLRNPARTASFEIDAVYTNPAGLALLPRNGFYFSLNNQTAFQTRTITSMSGVGSFEGFGGAVEKSFKGEANALFIPSLMGAYKSNNVVISFNVGVIGGGGTLTFDKGLPSFEAPISVLPGQLTAAGVPTNQYSVDAYLKGSSMILGGQLGITYAFNDVISGYAGARINILNNSYEGHLRNISVNPTHPVLNPTGAMMPAATFFNGAMQAAQTASAALQPIVDAGAGSFTLNQLVQAGQLPPAQLAQLAGGLGMSPEAIGALSVNQVQGAFNQAAASYKENADKVGDKNLDNSQSGMGITPILGLNLHFDRLNIGMKYEFQTKLEIENETKVDDTGLFPDGAKTPNDIPAILTLGAQYDMGAGVSVSAGYHHFFDSNAGMQNGKQEFINGGINEFLLGAEWKINKTFLISAGGQITRTGVTDEYQSDLAFSLNSYSIGFGGAINLSESLRVNVGYLFTNYEDWEKHPNMPIIDTIVPLPGTFKDIFARTNKAFGIGLDFRF